MNNCICYSFLGAKAAEGAHQSHCRVQKQTAAAPAKLRYSSPGSFCTGGPPSHVSQDAWPDDDGPTGNTSNVPAPCRDAPKRNARQDAPRTALYRRRPTPASCCSCSQGPQGAGSSWCSTRILPTGPWNPRCRSKASSRKTATA